MHRTDPELLYPAWCQRCQEDAVHLVDQVLPSLGPDLPHALRLAWLGVLKQLGQPRAAASTTSPTPPQAGTTLAGLSLMSDDEVNENIASSRLVQTLDGAADWALRELFNRCLVWHWHAEQQGLTHAVLLEPPALVNSLSLALADAGVPPQRRPALMNQLSAPLANQAKAMYQRQIEQLEAWGIAAQRMSIRRTPAVATAPATATPASAPPAPAGAPLASVSPAQVPALLQQLASDAGLNAAMSQVLARLAAPVQRSLTQHPQWRSDGANPMWRLVDRLACLAELDEAGRAAGEAPLHEKLRPMVDALEGAQMPLELAHYEKALNHVERLAQATQQATADTGRPSEAMLLMEERVQELSTVVHHQMVERLRGEPLQAGVRQFLLGPWVQVLSLLGARDGVDSPQVSRLTALIDGLSRAASRSLVRPPTPAEIDCLVLEASDGLAAIDTPRARVAQHCSDLRAELAQWPRPAPTQPQPLHDGPGEQAPATEAPSTWAGTLNAEASNWVHHADLATVPMAMGDGPNDATTAWVDSLAEGDLCRVFLRGRWTSARLDWLSDRRLYFTFSSKGHPPFSTSLRVLLRMRSEGLITTIQPGQWLREAANTLPADLS